MCGCSPLHARRRRCHQAASAEAEPVIHHAACGVVAGVAVRLVAETVPLAPGLLPLAPSAGYFGIAYRQTSWTMAYFATLDEFKKASSTVIPDSWGKAQQLSGGFAAGMFGACFNTPGDVIRSTIQKRALEGWARSAPKKVPFSMGLMAGGVKEFFTVAGEIAASKGVLVRTVLHAALCCMNVCAKRDILSARAPFWRARMHTHAD